MTTTVSASNPRKPSKKLAALSFFMAGALLSTSALAEVTLNVDDNIKVTVINGKSVNTSLFAPIQRSFTLQPGSHAITAKYDRLFDLRGDNHDYLHSGNVSITTNLQDNKTYTLTMPNQPDDYAAAKEYAKHPTLAVELNNQIIAQETATTSDDGGILSGITNAIGGVFSSDDAEASNREAIASLEKQSSPTQARTASVNNTSSRPVSVQSVPAVQPATNTNTSTLDSFMQLWLNATPQERAKIRQWVAE